MVTLNPASPSLNKIITKHLSILQSSSRCREVFPDNPFIAYRRPRNLRDYLVTAKLKHKRESATTSPPTIKKCNSKTFKTAPSLKTAYRRVHLKTQAKLTTLIKQTITCASKNLIYMIQCRKCINIPNAPAEYIGKIDETFITRQIWRTQKSHTTLDRRRSTTAF